MNKTLGNVLVVFLLAASQLAQASDIAREKRWADQVVDSIIDGDAIPLNDGSNEFLGIYTEVQADSQRAAIIMHGTGVHPNWQQVVYPLRVGLPEHGWSTLSIQMPILDAEAEHKAYAPMYATEVPARINAAIAYLRDKGVKHIVLIGHSQGSIMAAYYLRKQSDRVAAFVAIGMTCDFGEDPMNASLSLKAISLPVLDMYGSNDLESVLKSRPACVAAAKSAGNKQYTEKMLAGANHFFDAKDKELLDIVAGWLDKLQK
jgi:pimeloyl-ACP methyl ester carboxylesterase